MVETLLFGWILAGLRIMIGFTCEPEPFQWVQLYKDVAHLFIGGLFVAWMIQRHRWQKELFFFLCIVEVGVAVLSRL